MELLEAIKNRRSIRKYRTDPVDDDKVNTILEAGRWAPSWANTQCWRFVVVRDEKIRAGLADTLLKIKLPGKEIPNPAAGALSAAPVIIVVCAEIGKSGAGHGSDKYETDKGDWFMFDAALAAQNMVLTAHSLGLGTVIIGAFDAAKAEKVINVPDGYRIVTFFPVGVPEQAGKAPPRKELADIVIKDRWGK